MEILTLCIKSLGMIPSSARHITMAKDELESGFWSRQSQMERKWALPCLPLVHMCKWLSANGHQWHQVFKMALSHGRFLLELVLWRMSTWTIAVTMFDGFLIIKIAQTE